MTAPRCADCKHVEILTGECRLLVWQASQVARSRAGKCGPKGVLFEQQVGLRREWKAALAAFATSIIVGGVILIVTSGG